MSRRASPRKPMLPRSDKSKRIDPDCPPAVVQEVDATLRARLPGNGIYAGETMGDIVKRVCPEIFAMVERAGFRLRFDMPENTHKAACKGRVYYQIRRKASH